MPTRTIDPSEIDTAGTRTIDAGDIAPAPVAKKGIIQTMQDNLDSPEGLGPRPSDGTFGTAVHNVAGRAVGGLISPITHPLDTLKGISDSLPSFTGTGFNANNPIGQRIAEFKQEHETDPALAYENAAGDALGMLAQGKIIKGLTKAPLEKPVSPIPPHEENIKTLVQSAGVPEGQRMYLHKSLMGRNGEGEVASGVKDYAQRNGNLDISSPYKFGRVANLAADEGAQHFNQNILEPYKNDEIPAGDGKKMTIGAMNDRITELNKKEQNARIAAAGGNPVPMGSPSIEDMEMEAAGLRNRMGQYLASKTNIPTDELTNFRSYYGKLGAVGKQLERSGMNVGARDIEGKVNANPNKVGLSITHSLINRGSDLIHGGPEARFNKQFSSAIDQIPAKRYDFPQPAPTEAPLVVKPVISRADAARAAVARNKQLPSAHAIPPPPVQ